MIVNDRCVNLLENYEIEVNRTWKGRGSLLCETDKGILVLKEYMWHREKSVFQDAVLTHIRNRGFTNIEAVIRNKEGELLTIDQDQTAYMLKSYVEGRECDVRNMDECARAMKTLAKLHKASVSSKEEWCLDNAYTVNTVKREFEKHNKELRRVRKFLREKSQKTDFEIYLMQCYDYFFQLAMQIAEEFCRLTQEENQRGIICHGDFQHHNIIFSGADIHIINFEKCIFDSPVRDIYLFMRKLLEKSNWQQETGFGLLEAYEQENELMQEDYVGLYYRLAYPEKFWKIVNFYYNSGKAWIPGKNLEKLIKINEQEKEKIEFLETFRKKYAILDV